MGRAEGTALSKWLKCIRVVLYTHNMKKIVVVSTHAKSRTTKASGCLNEGSKAQQEGLVSESRRLSDLIRDQLSFILIYMTT